MVFFFTVFGLCSTQPSPEISIAPSQSIGPHTRHHSQRSGKERDETYRRIHTGPQRLLQLLASRCGVAGGRPTSCVAGKFSMRNVFHSGMGGEKNRYTVPSTEVMIPTHGFSPGLLGRRTRSLGRGGRRGGVSFVLPPLGGIVVLCH